MESNQNDAVVYTAQAAGTSVTGEVSLSVGEDSLAVIGLTLQIPYAHIRSFTIENYGVTVVTDSGEYRFQRMGSDGEPFYDALYDAYNKKVRKALFVSEAPIITTRGEYRYDECGDKAQGTALFEVYPNCVLILPPDDKARRVPLCFVTAMENGNFTLTLRLDTGESYTFVKLGYDTDPFHDALEKQLRILRENALLAVKKLDPSLTTIQATTVARQMPEGVAVPFGTLSAIAPSFVTALETEIKQTRPEEFEVLKTICDPKTIYAGIMKRFTQGASDTGEDSEVLKDVDVADLNAQDETMVWLLAPGENGHTAAVEFAVAEGESAATFIYRFEGGFDSFARSFNRALEAISFKREGIRLSEQELLKPEYAHYFMAARRNNALRLIRACYLSRVIHASPEKWKAGLLAYMR